MSRAIDVLVAHSDLAVADRAATVLRSTFAVAPPVTDLRHVGDAAAEHRPRALLIEMIWPDGPVLSRISEFLSTNQGLQVCVFSTDPAPSSPNLVLAAGACGFVAGPVREDALMAAVASILAGGVYLLPGFQAAETGVAEVIATRLPRRAIIVHEPGSPEYQRSVAWISRDRHLTWRQAEAALGVRDGYSEKQIAARMGCSNANVHALLDEARTRMAGFGVHNGASLSAVVEMSLGAKPSWWRSDREVERRA